MFLHVLNLINHFHSFFWWPKLGKIVSRRALFYRFKTPRNYGAYQKFSSLVYANCRDDSSANLLFLSREIPYPM